MGRSRAGEGESGPRARKPFLSLVSPQILSLDSAGFVFRDSGAGFSIFS